MDARGDDIRAHGYQKGKKKVPSGNMKLMKRTTDPQTIYITDSMHRDDIIDITDFDVVEYQYGVMRQTLLEEVATAILIGDGRDEADEHKISEEHVRSIWNDDDLYTIHYDVDIEAARNELQGTGTASRFGENYIYAEAIITAALYSREKFKGTGTPDFFCTPHLVNVMLLARDTNGRRIQAHGGALYYDDGVYYWYGENKDHTDGKCPVWTWGMRAYRSTDLCNWEDLGLFIQPDLTDKDAPLYPTSRADRPHIVKCAYTGKYVCWIKHCGDNACFTVLQADKFLGPYEIVKAHYRPFGCEVGDFDIAVCGDTAYLLSLIHI